MKAERPPWWETRSLLAVLLWPLSALFSLLVVWRAWCYRIGLFSVARLPVPVVVVGNIAVGGSGKTPLVIWLAEALSRAGWRPGIISRGHGASASAAGEVVEVDPLAPAAARLYGDEPVLLASRLALPVVIGRDRVQAARVLLAAHPQCNLLISDDGLQHYRLGRDVEIVVVDEAMLGNRWLLPAGPLREGIGRLGDASACVLHGPVSEVVQRSLPSAHFAMALRGTRLRPVRQADAVLTLADWAGQTVHAVAGIGRPARFFAALRAAGLNVIAHPFPDHHPFEARDLAFGDDLPILMTEKDAVKCAAFAPPQAWYLPVDADLPVELADLIVEKLNGSQTA